MLGNKLNIYVLNYNGLALLKQFFHTIVQYAPVSKNIYLIDNASKDGSVEWVKKKFPSITIFKNQSNLGYAGGFHQCISKNPSPYFCILNNDILIKEDIFTNIISYLENHNNIGIIQPKILNLNKPAMFDYAGGAGGMIDTLGYPSCLGRSLFKMERDQNQYEQQTEIFWASGACMFARSAVWRQTGGFDKKFFAHMEEIDLCWRAKNMGWKIYNFPSISVYHLGGGSLSYNNSKKTYLNYRNNIVMLYKNLPTLSFLWLMCIRCFLDTLNFIRLLFCLKVNNAFMIVKAYTIAFIWVIALKRKKAKRLKLGNHTGTIKNIVWRYFMKR